MSLETCMGREQNVFEQGREHADRLVISSPVLSNSKMHQCRTLGRKGYEIADIDLDYPESEGLEAAIARICEESAQAVRDGKTLLVISDKKIREGYLPANAVLATGAIHHYLSKTGLRTDANLILETAVARDPHQFAVILGFGATAIYPYLAYDVINDLIAKGELLGDPIHAQANFRKGIEKGLLNVLSKMGISTVASYRGGQLFEAVGLSAEVVNTCFIGVPSRIQGATFADLENDQKKLADLAWKSRKPIDQGGMLKFVFDKEYHAFNPDVINALHKAVRSGNYADFKEYAEIVNNRPIATIRDLFKLKTDNSIALDQVESVEQILPRFDSAGMSLGALSPEAHEAIAIAMNTIGGRSNSGEGGQLPGGKVNGLIARLRYSVPGVTLISPPPHHDIYSIEDLSQLIFDLKQVNPKAMVSVKLVSEPGVGTIAAGVAKAYADFITISGYDGGTAASPLSSIHHAGSPWELGLSAAHQTLRGNDLRGKGRVQTDGGLKTGLDVIKAAILGAESFGFGTAPMIALGCKYLRICHLNNCATGVATQNDQLRKDHFIGTVDMVINYFTYVAEDTREWLAKLGVRSLAELIGRTDLLEVLPGETAKQGNLDLSPLLGSDYIPADKPQFCQVPKNPPFDEGRLAEKMVEMAKDAIANKTGGEYELNIGN